MRSQTKRFGRRRLRAVRADLIVPGDTLWSSATNRPLVVIAAARVPVRADGNLYDEHELGDELEPDAGGPARATAIVLSVMNPDGSTQRLGGYAEHARLQVLR